MIQNGLFGEFIRRRLKSLSRNILSCLLRIFDKILLKSKKTMDKRINIRMSVLDLYWDYFCAFGEC